MDQVTRSLTVKGDPEHLYELWSAYETFPEFMPGVESVLRTGPRTSCWAIRGPLGKTVEWEAETTMAEPGKRLAWNTVDGDVRTSGQVVFADLGNGQTSITVTLNWSATGETIAKALKDPEDLVARALRAFKEHAERAAVAA